MRSWWRAGPSIGTTRSDSGSPPAAKVAGKPGAWGRRLADGLEPAVHAERLSDFAFRLPVYVIASLLGVAVANLAQTARWMGDFVRCLAPASTPEQIEQGKAAAEHLAQQF